MRHLVVLVLYWIPAFWANACINISERIPGVGIEDVQFNMLGDVIINKDSLQGFIRGKTAECGSRSDRTCNDLVIAHLFAEEFKKALELSTRLVARYPNDYSVVITHAAALELNGKPGEASPFMKHALELNPKSHKGSEWIHLRILEQRLLGDAGVDPWKLIGVDLRPDSLPEKPEGMDMKELLRQVHYQVNDRRFFTPEHDPLYGALMFAYADLLQLNGYRNQAKWTYSQAASYGFTYAQKATAPAQPVLKDEPAPVKSLPPPVITAKTEEQASHASLYAWLLIGVVVAGIGGFIWRNSRTA